MLVKRSDFPFFPSLMDDVFKDFSKSNNAMPAVNIKENEKAFIIEMAIPGFTKQEVTVNIENHVLTIASEKQMKSDAETQSYTRKEYGYQSFKRSFNLPKDIVDSDKVSANHVNGELIITIPKVEKEEPKSKLIEIQ